MSKVDALPINLYRARYATEQNGDVLTTADRFSEQFDGEDATRDHTNPLSPPTYDLIKINQKNGDECYKKGGAIPAPAAAAGHENPLLFTYGGLGVTDKVKNKDEEDCDVLVSYDGGVWFNVWQHKEGAMNRFPVADIPDSPQRIRSLMDLPVHVTTEHVIGFLDVVGLIRLSATCRTWYGVRRSVLQTKLSAASSVSPLEAVGFLNFSPERAHRYAHWVSECPRALVDAIVDRYGKEQPTDVLEAMVMLGRRKAWPWMDHFHSLVLRDVMFWYGGVETEKIRRLLEDRTLAYEEWGLLDEPYNDPFFADRVVSTKAEWDAFKGEWLTAMRTHPVLRWARAALAINARNGSATRAIIEKKVVDDEPFPQ